jgi:putative SOS response-associated peptidase YedK
MCRFYVIKKTAPAPRFPELLFPLEEDLEVRPGVKAPALLLSKEGELICKKIPFGSFAYEKLLYNARSETVMEKSFFQEAFLHQKAVFPCSCFEEALSDGLPKRFSGEDATFYLLGFYKKDGFILLTKENPEKGKGNPPRMPCPIKKEGIVSYLSGQKSLEEILSLFEEKVESETHGYSWTPLF